MKGKAVMIVLEEYKFQLEAAMISNPSLRALQYNMYGKNLMDKRYNTKATKTFWRGAVEAAGSTNLNDFES